MRIVGLITEYNPFHNGHRHHLQESLRVAAADASVAVMSGHFLQRGEPALVDKWLRAEMALAAGVDLVLELPFAFACNSAPHFATGAVQTLNALGVVDAFCFGSEAGELASLDRIAQVLVEKADAIEVQTSAQLRQGKSYPVARAEVLTGLLPDVSPKTMASPNNILGLEYLRALKVTEGSLEPFTISRLGAGYHSTEAAGSIASATGIRQKLSEGGDVSSLMPDACWAILEKALAQGQCLDIERLFTVLQASLLQESETLHGLYHVNDGLEKRLTDAAMTAQDYAELAGGIKSRQWTLTRIQRILSYVLMRISGAEMEAFLESGPLYLRLLGASEKGRQVLAKARKKRTLPMISDPARAMATLRRFYRNDPERGKLAEQMLACDLRATRLYGVMQKVPQEGHRNRDFFVRV